MASSVRPRVTGRPRRLFEASPLIVKGSDGMAQNVLVHLVANPEGIRPHPIVQVDDRVDAGRGDVGEVEPPGAVTAYGIDAAGTPGLRRALQNDFSTRFVDDSKVLAGRVAGERVVADARRADDRNLDRRCWVAELIDHDGRDGAVDADADAISCHQALLGGRRCPIHARQCEHYRVCLKRAP